MDGIGYARAEKRVADDTVLDLRKRNDVKYTPNDAKGLIAQNGDTDQELTPSNSSH